MDQSPSPAQAIVRMARLAAGQDDEDESLGATAPEVSGPAQDVYRIGATIYRFLTGFYPYWSEEELEKLRPLPPDERLRRYRRQVQISALIPLRKVNPQVDGDLADLIEACLRKSPERRPADMAAILEDLRRRERGLPLLCRRPWPWSYRLRRRSGRPVVAAVLATLALVGSSLYGFQRSQQAELEQRRQLQQRAQEQAGRAQDFGDAQLWWCEALKYQPEDPVLRMRLGRESAEPPRPRWTAEAPGKVQQLAWGPGQQWLWVGAEDGIVRVSAEGRLLEKRLWTAPARSYAMSPDGKGVAELEGGLQLFWPGGVHELARYQPGQFEAACQRVFFSQDGHWLLASMPGFLKLWQVEGEKIHPAPSVAIAEPPQLLALSADGKYMAALCAKPGAARLKLGVWRVPDLRGVPLAVSEIPFHGKPLQLAFGPQSEWLLVGSGGHLCTLSLGEPTQLGRWRMELEPEAPFVLGKSWMLASRQKVSLPEGSPGWRLPLVATALAARGDLVAVSSRVGTSLLDARDGSELRPGLGIPELSALAWGERGLLGARRATVGFWTMSEATGTPEDVMARWEKLTGRKRQDFSPR